jgi:hypothetical protein
MKYISTTVLIILILVVDENSDQLTKRTKSSLALGFS